MTVEVRVVPMSGHEFLGLGLMATICCYHGYHLPCLVQSEMFEERVLFFES